MNVIQQTIKIDFNSRMLPLERPLPENVNAGHVDAIIAFRPPDSTFERALELYKQGGYSVAGAAYAGGVDRFDFENFLADIHYPIPQQTVEEVNADIDRVERMLKAEGNWPPRARSL